MIPASPVCCVRCRSSRDLQRLNMFGHLQIAILSWRTGQRHWTDDVHSTIYRLHCLIKIANDPHARKAVHFYFSKVPVTPDHLTRNRPP
jgi:hypothetical protein